MKKTSISGGQQREVTHLNPLASNGAVAPLASNPAHTNGGGSSRGSYRITFLGIGGASVGASVARNGARGGIGGASVGASVAGSSVGVGGTVVGGAVVGSSVGSAVVVVGSAVVVVVLVLLLGVMFSILGICLGAFFICLAMALVRSGTRLRETRMSRKLV